MIFVFERFVPKIRSRHTLLDQILSKAVIGAILSFTEGFTTHHERGLRISALEKGGREFSTQKGPTSRKAGMSIVLLFCACSVCFVLLHLCLRVDQCRSVSFPCFFSFYYFPHEFSVGSFVLFCFVLFRFVSFRFVSFRFVSFCFILFW
jgi:hypothetical protein